MKPNSVEPIAIPIPPPPPIADNAKCSVCGEPQAPNSGEGLCWVCRRLKISAWRDSDLQQPGQQE